MATAFINGYPNSRRDWQVRNDSLRPATPSEGIGDTRIEQV